ncbi:MAG: hypothetical protein ABEJ69_01815 [Candidatus Nanohaloarchaea archaeon]
MENSPSNPVISRRDLLALLGVTAAGGYAVTRLNGSSGREGAGYVDGLRDDDAPTILSYRAEPDQYGSVLSVSMQGRDNKELGEAAVMYGDQRLEKTPDGKTVTLQGKLEPDEDTKDPDRVAYLLQDEAGNQTRKEAYPDQDAPELAVKTSATENAGELELLLEGRDDIGLQELTAVLNGETALERNVSKAEKAAIDTILTEENVAAIQPFQKNTIKGTARDQYDNKTEKTVEQYVRKYDKMEDTRLDIGAVYISQQGNGFRQRCRESYEGTEPAVGIYDEDPIPTDVTTRHIDQMTGHGINRLVFDYAGWPREEDRVYSLMDSHLIDQITVEPFLVKMPFIRNMSRSWKDEIMPRDLPPLRDHFLSRDNAATIDGRPVVSTWSFSHFVYDPESKTKIMDEFGSYEAFVDDMRSHLRVDGTDPFLIVGKGPYHLQDGGKLHELVRHFDGLTTWFPGGEWRNGEDESWEEIINRVEGYFENNHQYATDHGMEFVPKVFPGYDEDGDGCNREGNRHIPRSPDRFRQLLDLAEQYTTGEDRIDIATWNGWVEGHHIEPGTFKGNNYGAEYVEAVREFQSDSP